MSNEIRSSSSDSDNYNRYTNNRARGSYRALLVQSRNETKKISTVISCTSYEYVQLVARKAYLAASNSGHVDIAPFEFPSVEPPPISLDLEFSSNLNVKEIIETLIFDDKSINECSTHCTVFLFVLQYCTLEFIEKRKRDKRQLRNSMKKVRTIISMHATKTRR